MAAIERVSLEPVWVLHHYAYRDSSLLLEIFSRDHGRIGLVARGARSAKSRWHSRLQMLQPLLMSWNLRGDLGTVTGVESRAPIVMPRGREVLSACYLNELLLRLLTRHDPHPVLFAAYEKAISSLGSAQEQVLRYFEKHLLQELGYGLLLERESGTGQPVDPAALYEYHLEQGPVRCRETGRAGIFIHGSTLLALSGESISGQQACREAKKLTCSALSLYLGPRPLKTREVLHQLSSLGQARTQQPENVATEHVN